MYNEKDAIYILLLYHGKKEWNLPLTFYSSHGNAAFESMIEGTVDVRVKVSYIVRDLCRMTKKQLAWRSDEKRYTSTALWYIMRDNEMDTEGLKEIAQLLNGLSSQDFTDLAESVLGYLKDLGLYEQFEKINRKLYPRQSFAAGKTFYKMRECQAQRGLPNVKLLLLEIVRSTIFQCKSFSRRKQYADI